MEKKEILEVLAYYRKELEKEAERQWPNDPGDILDRMRFDLIDKAESIQQRPTLSWLKQAIFFKRKELIKEQLAHAPLCYEMIEASNESRLDQDLLVKILSYDGPLPGVRSWRVGVPMVLDEPDENKARMNTLVSLLGRETKDDATVSKRIYDFLRESIWEAITDIELQQEGKRGTCRVWMERAGVRDLDRKVNAYIERMRQRLRLEDLGESFEAFLIKPVMGHFTPILETMGSGLKSGETEEIYLTIRQYLRGLDGPALGFGKILLLRHVEGLELKEVGQCMGMTHDQVRYFLKKAEAHLRSYLDPENN